MGILLLAFMLALVVGALWIIEVGQLGEDASTDMALKFRWAMGKGKEYAWIVAHALFKR
jgi:hypothetical protein